MNTGARCTSELRCDPGQWVVPGGDREGCNLRGLDNHLVAVTAAGVIGAKRHDALAPADIARARQLVGHGPALLDMPIWVWVAEHRARPPQLKRHSRVVRGLALRRRRGFVCHSNRH